MTEDEYFDGERDENEEFQAEFMIQEPPDIDVILMPKLNFDTSEFLDRYVKLIRKCKNKSDAKSVLWKLFMETQSVTLLQNDLDELQSKAKLLELELQGFRIR